MHSNRFDNVTRALVSGASRRQVFRGVVGGAVGGLLARAGYELKGEGPATTHAAGEHQTFLPLIQGRALEGEPWTGQASYEGQTTGIRFVLREEGGTITGRMFLQDPNTAGFIESGTVEGTRTGDDAQWTTQADSVVEGTFTENSFTGTITFPERNEEPGFTANLVLTHT